MNRSSISKGFFSLGLSVTLLLTPGCKLFSGSESDSSECVTCPAQKQEQSSEQSAAVQPLTGDVLVSVDGTPLMTVDSFEKEYNMVLDANPQVKQLIELFPDVKDRIFDGLLNQKMIDIYVEKNKLNESADYQAQLQDMIRGAKQMLNDSFFTKSVAPSSVTDAEARAYYEQNKAGIPELIISRGGTMAQAVSFADEEKARAFAAKIKQKPSDIQTVAQQEGIADNFKDYKLINSDSLMVDSAVRNKVLALSAAPAVETVKGTDGNFYVVAALSKEEPKYEAFEKIKEGLKSIVLQEKQQEIKQSKIDGLKKEYKVQINTQYFDKAKQQQKNDKMEQIQQAIEQQQKAQESHNAQKSSQKAPEQKAAKQQKAA